MSKKLIEKTYITEGTCSSEINLVVDTTGIILEAEFVGGCPGNTLGIGKLIIGKSAVEVADSMRGIQCGFKPTSCPDQLSKALDEIIEENNLTM